MGRGMRASNIFPRFRVKTINTKNGLRGLKEINKKSAIQNA
jgi:hypothetical protein